MATTDIAPPVVSERIRSKVRRGWVAHALALGCYALLTVIATFPLIRHLDSHIIANEFGAVDGYLGIWNIWWTAQALQTGQSPFVTPLLFHPDGLDLFWQTLSLPQGLPAFPITVTAGPLVAYNLLILAGFLLGGYTAFLFVRYVVGSNAAALVGGAVYGFAPFHLQKVVDAQLEVASIQWVPLYLLALHHLLDRPRRQRVLVAGLLLLWVGLGTWYYGLFCLVYTGLAAGIWALRMHPQTEAPRADQQATGWLQRLWQSVRVRLSIRTLLWGLAPIGIWLLLMTPRLISLLQTGDTYLGDAREFNARSSADLIAFWLPNPLHPLWGATITEFYTDLHRNAMLWNVSLGLVALALALLGGIATWRTDWRWLLLLAATLLLAMGEELRVFGIETGIPLPYALLADLPGIRAGHRPNHFVILSMVLMALLAAQGALQLFQRRPRQRYLLTALLLPAILLIDGWAQPLPLFSRPIPAAYAQLPEPDPDGALLPIPVHINFSRSENLWYQTRHGWPIIGGFIGREPPYHVGKYAPGISELRYGRRVTDDILALDWPELARATLAAYDIRYIIYHPDTMGSSLPRMHTLMDELGFTATYQDATAEIYPVPEVAAPEPLVYLGRGWGGVEQNAERRWRWIGAQAELHLLNPLDEPQVVELELHMESYRQPRLLTLRLDAVDLGPIEVSRAAMRRTFRLWLEPGEHVLYLSVPTDSAPDDQGRQLGVAFLGIELHPVQTVEMDRAEMPDEGRNDTK